MIKLFILNYLQLLLNLIQLNWRLIRFRFGMEISTNFIRNERVNRPRFSMKCSCSTMDWNTKENIFCFQQQMEQCMETERNFLLSCLAFTITIHNIEHLKKCYKKPLRAKAIKAWHSFREGKNSILSAPAVSEWNSWAVNGFSCTFQDLIVAFPCSSSDIVPWIKQAINTAKICHPPAHPP